MTSLITWQRNNILRCTTVRNIKKKLAMVVVASALANVSTAMSVPVVPNFTQGSMTSTTETTSTVTETINSMQYDTGYQHVITGTNIEHDGNTISCCRGWGNRGTIMFYVRARYNVLIACIIAHTIYGLCHRARSFRRARH